MTQDHFSLPDEDLDITFGATSPSGRIPSSPFSSHLVTAALVRLIEEADVEGWEKNEMEITQPTFLAAILAAVARSYNYSLPEPLDDAAPYDILKQLIEELHENGYL